MMLWKVEIQVEKSGAVRDLRERVYFLNGTMPHTPDLSNPTQRRQLLGQRKTDESHSVSISPGRRKSQF
jgi:hypothetical protein